MVEFSKGICQDFILCIVVDWYVIYESGWAHLCSCSVVAFMTVSVDATTLERLKLSDLPALSMLFKSSIVLYETFWWQYLYFSSIHSDLGFTVLPQNNVPAVEEEFQPVLQHKSFCFALQCF